MEMTVREAKRNVESLQALQKNLVAFHNQILQLQEDLPGTKDIVCDDPIVDAIAYLSDYENVIMRAIDNAKISL